MLYGEIFAEAHKPSRKKITFSIKPPLRSYLKRYGREVPLPVEYRDMMRFTYARPLIDNEGKETAWEEVSYDMREWEYLNESLVKCYSILKTEGDFSFAGNLRIERIDFCSFGNSQPFRIKVINVHNGHYDFFYIKKADASRVYGLELENMLSTSRVVFHTCNETLVEEHIAGVPGDVFIKDYLQRPDTDMIRVVKSFVKFNEVCFIRLLGDMRSYNFVVRVIPDIEMIHYKFRAIDFDQQCYEGRSKLYIPQFAKENYPLVKIGSELLNQESFKQYRAEERSRLVYRIAVERYRMKALMDVMIYDEISVPEKIDQLKLELANYHKDIGFLKLKTMGQILKRHMKKILGPHMANFSKSGRKRML